MVSEYVWKADFEIIFEIVHGVFLSSKQKMNAATLSLVSINL